MLPPKLVNDIDMARSDFLEKDALYVPLLCPQKAEAATTCSLALTI
jgi:hypothetical protein